MFVKILLCSSGFKASWCDWTQLWEPKSALASFTYLDLLLLDWHACHTYTWFNILFHIWGNCFYLSLLLLCLDVQIQALSEKAGDYLQVSPSSFSFYWCFKGPRALDTMWKHSFPELRPLLFASLKNKIHYLIFLHMVDWSCFYAPISSPTSRSPARSFLTNSPPTFLSSPFLCVICWV